MERDLKKQSYCIAGIRIQAEAVNVRFSEYNGVLEAYTDGEAGWDHHIRLRMEESLPPPRGVCMHQGCDRLVFQDEGRCLVYLGPVGRSLEHAKIRLSREGSQTELCFLRNPTGEIRPRELLNAMDLPHILTVHGGFLLHASFVAYNGRAILFTAPSETGKSTQAQLWCDHLGAELVNGDRAAVRIFADGVMACGVPFSGSSPVRRNVTLPLAAIVYLSQAPENSITRLRGVRSFRRVWEGCTVNTWDRQDVELATQTVSEVVGRVPVYHLACTPDIRAVELLKKTMEVDV